MPSNYCFIHEKQKKVIIKMHTCGLKTKNIASAMGFSACTIWQATSLWACTGMVVNHLFENGRPWELISLEINVRNGILVFQSSHKHLCSTSKVLLNTPPTYTFLRCWCIDVPLAVPNTKQNNTGGECGDRRLQGQVLGGPTVVCARHELE
jgi:hypothetical protein